jgi:hypothetical protein
MITEKEYLEAQMIIKLYESQQLNISVVRQRYNMKWRKTWDAKNLFNSINAHKKCFPSNNHINITTPMMLTETTLQMAYRLGYKITLIKEWCDNSNCDYYITWEYNVA